MKLYAVWFRVQYEGDSLKGIFSTVENAREQLERCKVVHETYGNYTWVETYKDVWERADLTLEIAPITVDAKSYE